MSFMKLSLGAHGPDLTVERFSVREGISELFTVQVTARATHPRIDPANIVGRGATLEVMTGYTFALDKGRRVWSGVCESMRVGFAHGEKEQNLYHLVIRPNLWLLGQRSNHRIFQHLSIPQIVDELLGEWKIEPKWSVDREAHPKLEYKVQYRETDLAFLERLLGDAGIAFVFEEDPTRGSVLALSDRLTQAEPRSKEPLPFVHNANDAGEKEYVAGVRARVQVRPGALSLCDHDFRNPNHRLVAKTVPRGAAPEPTLRLDQYHPGVMLHEGGAGGQTPVADDRGVARRTDAHGKVLAERQLDALRADRRRLELETNAINLRPGTVFTMDHPNESLSKRELMVTALEVTGERQGEWEAVGQAVFAAEPYRPPLEMRLPRVPFLQHAIVVGPAGEEIHTDEYGRVRVLFPWDRQGKADERASCWLRVSQGWSGAGYGMSHLPRVGQEVLVAFENGDPDCPVVLARAHDALNPVPYALPNKQTVSTWRSQTSPGGGGFNELRFDDERGAEELFWHAQKNLRKLVKNDEVTTIDRDRDVLTKRDELQTIVRQLVEVTGKARAELTEGDRVAVIGLDSVDRTVKSEHVRLEAKHRVRLGSQHHVVGGEQRVRVEGDLHTLWQDDRSAAVGGKQSVIVGGPQHLQVGEGHAVDAALQMHLRSGTKIVAEAGAEVTLKAGAGFVRIDASGVTVRGTLVRINSGGAPGAGSGSQPDAPKLPEQATVPPPPKRLREIRAKSKQHDLPLPDLKEWPRDKDVPKVALEPHDGDRPEQQSDRALHWVSIELVDDEGNPVSSERYEVTLPDGKRRVGQTGKDGKAKIEAIAQGGMCKVTFPRLDRDTWRKA